MLTLLRRNKENLLIKIVLGIIILSFAAFFGISAMQPGGQVLNSPAKVNGENINPARYNYYLDNQMDRLKEAFKDNIPPEYLNGAKRSVVNTLINQTLITQELKKYGLQVTPAELADNIKNNEDFFRNGEFDFYYYQNRFLPGYNLQTGGSYEKDAMRELLTQKLFSQFTEILKPSKKELSLENTINNTMFEFSVIKVFTKDIDEETKLTDDTKTTKKEKSKLKPEEKANKVFAEWKSGNDIQKLLDENKLTINKMPKMPPAKIKSVFGGKGKLKHLKELISLNKKNPFPKQPILEDNYYYLVKLTDLERPKDNIKENENLFKKLKSTYEKTISTNLQSAFIKDLRKKADIKIFE